MPPVSHRERVNAWEPGSGSVRTTEPRCEDTAGRDQPRHADDAGADRLLAGLDAAPARAARRHPRRARAARAAVWGDWPDWADPAVVAALQRRGRAAAVRPPGRGRRPRPRRAGRWSSSTGTASGKSLAYLLPALTAVARGAVASRRSRRHRALPQPDQGAGRRPAARAGASWTSPGCGPRRSTATPPTEERDWARAHAAYVLTNPDMLHRSLLPGHARWAPFWRALRFVVVDECHTYRGVFGSHVAAVLRRLRRVARGTAPTRCSCSPRRPSRIRPASAGLLVGTAVAAVTHDGSPRGRDVLRALGAAADRPASASAAPRCAGRCTPRPPTCWPTWWSKERAPSPSSGRGAAPRWSRMTTEELLRRGRPVAARAGGGVPRAATCPRSDGPSRPTFSPAGCSGVAATSALELGRRRGRARRGAAGRLAGHPCVDVAAGRARRAGRAGSAGGARGPRRPARHLPGPPPRGAVRAPGRGDRARPDQPLRPRRRTCARPRPSSR